MLQITANSLDFLRKSRAALTLADPDEPDCPLVYVNGRFEEITGYKNSEVIGKNCRFLQCPETHQNDIVKLKESISLQQQNTVCIRNKRKCGERFWNLLYISPVEIDGRTIIMGCQYDISEYTTVQDVTENAQSLTATLTDSKLNPDGLFTVEDSIKRQALSVFQIFQSKVKMEQKTMPRNGMNF